MRILTTVKAALLLLLLVLCACSPAQLKPAAEPVSSPLEPAELTFDQQLSAVRQRVSALLTAGETERAKTALLDARRKKIDERHLAGLYATVTNRLLEDAAQASSAGRLAEAGTLYRQARDIYPQDAQRQATIDMSMAEINAKLESCADQLMTNGLVAYRSGELAAAVEIWKQIDRFHPDHSPSQIAIGTAERQLRTLETMDSFK